MKVISRLWVKIARWNFPGGLIVGRLTAALIQNMGGIHPAPHPTGNRLPLKYPRKLYDVAVFTRQKLQKPVLLAAGDSFSDYANCNKLRDVRSQPLVDFFPSNEIGRAACKASFLAGGLSPQLIGYLGLLARNSPRTQAMVPTILNSPANRLPGRKLGFLICDGIRYYNSPRPSNLGSPTVPR